MSYISSNNNKLEILHDINGNIYITQEYLLMIDNKNNLELLKINKNLLFDKNNNIKYNKIIKTDCIYGLKNKTIDYIENNLDTDEINEDEQNDINNFIYYPEDKYYKTEDIDIIDDDNCYFDFFGTCNCSDIKLDTALYDTIIINGGLSSTNVLFRSKLINDLAIYRITIYTDGFIKLNIVGTKIITYKLDNLTLNKI